MNRWRRRSVSTGSRWNLPESRSVGRVNTNISPLIRTVRTKTNLDYKVSYLQMIRKRRELTLCASLTAILQVSLAPSKHGNDRGYKPHGCESGIGSARIGILQELVVYHQVLRKRSIRVQINRKTDRSSHQCLHCSRSWLIHYSATEQASSGKLMIPTGFTICHQLHIHLQNSSLTFPRQDCGRVIVDPPDSR
jgi:hypothetical protein